MPSDRRSTFHFFVSRMAPEILLGGFLVFISACQTVQPAKGMARVSAAVQVEDTTSPGTSIGEEAVLQPASATEL